MEQRAGGVGQAPLPAEGVQLGCGRRRRLCGACFLERGKIYLLVRYAMILGELRMHTWMEVRAARSFWLDRRCHVWGVALLLCVCGRQLRLGGRAKWMTSVSSDGVKCAGGADITREAG
jgi:hypothetical protein